MLRNHTRDYYRKVRAKTINKKKNLAKKIYGSDYYDCDGMYSKNKIFCSCHLCRPNGPSWNRIKKARTTISDIRELMEDISDVNISVINILTNKEEKCGSYRMIDW
jgi:hypothetical protein